MLSWFTRSLQSIPCFTDASIDIIYHTGNVDSGLPKWRSVKNLPSIAGDTRDMGSIPWLERSPGVGNGNPLQYSCLENSMDRGAWWTTVHGVPKSQTQLSMSINVESLLLYCKISYLIVHIIFHWKLIRVFNLV